MDLKYYLRGLGVGIVVTALIMGIASSVDSKEALSDDEIRERARALGMVEESTVLADTLAQGNVDSSVGGASGEEEPEAVPSPTSDQEEEASAPEEEETSPSPEAEEDEEIPETSAEPKAAEKEVKPSQSPSPTPVPSASPSPKPTAEPTATPSPEPTSEPASTPVAVSETDAGTSQGESITIHIAGGDSSLTVCKKLAQAGLIESASEYDAYLCQNGYDKRIRAGSFEIPVGAGEEEIAGIILKLK